MGRKSKYTEEQTLRALKEPDDSIHSNRRNHTRGTLPQIPPYLRRFFYQFNFLIHNALIFPWHQSIAKASTMSWNGFCRPALASRFACVRNRVYLGDLNHGRWFVLSTEGNQLKELRGFTVKGPLQVCAENLTTQVSNVSDGVASP